MSEMDKIEQAIDAIWSLLFIPLHNCQIDPDPYWEKAHAACEACADPQKTALVFILSQIAVEMMGGQQ